MRTLGGVPGIFLLFAIFLRPIKASDCCQTKTVRDAPKPDSRVNGVYTLKTELDSKPDPICIDACVYVKDNQEYCFREEAGATPTVDCEVA